MNVQELESRFGIDAEVLVRELPRIKKAFDGVGSLNLTDRRKRVVDLNKIKRAAKLLADALEHEDFLFSVSATVATPNPNNAAIVLPNETLVSSEEQYEKVSSLGAIEYLANIQEALRREAEQYAKPNTQGWAEKHLVSRLASLFEKHSPHDTFVCYKYQDGSCKGIFAEFLEAVTPYFFSSNAYYKAKSLARRYAER